MHPVAGPFKASDDIAGVDRLHLLAADARPHTEQAVGRIGLQHAVVWNASWKDVADRNLESNRENVKACEYVFGRRLGAACAGNSAEIAGVQVDEVEDSFLIELVRIVELAGNDPPTIRQRVDERVDKCLIEKTNGSTRSIPGIVTLEGAETINESICLRAVVVRENWKIVAKDDFLDGRLKRSKRRHNSRRRRQPRDGHRLGAAGELPQQLVAAPKGIVRARRAFGHEAVLELDAIDETIGNLLGDADMELVPVAVACTQALIALTRLVEGVEVHDQIKPVVRAVRRPGKSVRVVCTRLVQDRKGLAVARGRNRSGERQRKHNCQTSRRYIFHAHFFLLFNGSIPTTTGAKRIWIAQSSFSELVLVLPAVMFVTISLGV